MPITTIAKLRATDGTPYVSPTSVVVDPADLPDLLTLARGPYQRALLRGQQAASGADLRGNARRYSVHYAASRSSLWRRLSSAGYHLTIGYGHHNRLYIIVTKEATRP